MEYSPKAKLPDREPTDYEKRDPKNRSGAGVDKRKAIKVVAELQTHNDTMAQGIMEIVLFVLLGELKCCELELCNNCNATGPVIMTRLYLVSQTPGLVRYGRKKNEEKKSFYNFPLIEDNRHQFRREREVRIDLIPVPEPEGSVQSGSRIQISVWLRRPDILGTSHHNLSVSNDNIISPSKSSTRLTCLTLSLMCQPCLRVQCRMSGLLSYSNTPGQQVDMSRTNVDKDLDPQ